MAPRDSAMLFTIGVHRGSRCNPTNLATIISEAFFRTQKAQIANAKAVAIAIPVMMRFALIDPQAECTPNTSIFGKLSRLSENARMGSILIAYENVLDEMPPDLSIGAKRTFLRESATTVVWEALRVIKRVNGLYAHSALQALTEFGCAFAIACSDVCQDLSKAQDIIQTFGLLEDLAEFEIDSNPSGLEERLETASETFEVHENTAKKYFAAAP